MITKGIKKYLANPSIGLTASILYILLYVFTKDIGLSLIISILFTGISDIFLRYYTKTKICGLMFILTLAALIITLVAWAILRYTFIPDITYILLFEILMVCLLSLARLSKTYIGIYLGRQESIVQKAFLGEFFDVAHITQYALTLHIFVVLIYRLIRVNYGFNDVLNIFFYMIIPVLILLVIVIYEEWRTKRIVSQLRQEEWLPIVNESGEVTGRIARSVSKTMKNKFMHPVVRVALIHNGEIYLQKRTEADSLDPSKYDHPFEKFMLFSHEINIAVRNSISRSLGMQELPFNFLLKYVFENDNTKRLIFLFVARVETEDQLDSLSLLNGKFWTTKQIDESFADEDLFSECFQLEYEYLKNTVIQADLIKKELAN